MIYFKLRTFDREKASRSRSVRLYRSECTRTYRSKKNANATKICEEPAVAIATTGVLFAVKPPDHFLSSAVVSSSVLEVLQKFLTDSSALSADALVL